MLSYIRGTLEEIHDRSVVVEASGIGFEIRVGSSVLRRLPDLHQPVRLFVYLQILEDDRKLYGFWSAEEKEIFLKLISVSGVGPKGASQILDLLSPEGVVAAVLSDDYKAISKANGIGPKTAQKVVLELKDKLSVDSLTGGLAPVSREPDSEEDNVISEAAEALTTLGYTNQESLRAIRKIRGADQMKVEDLIRAALKVI